MKLKYFMLAACILLTSCSKKFTKYDEFTGKTTTQSAWVDTTNSSMFEYFEIAAVKVSSSGMPDEYRLSVRVGNMYDEKTRAVIFPEIQEGNYLHLLVDGENMKFRSLKGGLCKEIRPGFITGWCVETAIYGGVTKEDVIKIASAQEVKLKVFCANTSCVGKLSPKGKGKLVKFVKENIDSSFN